MRALDRGSRTQFRATLDRSIGAAPQATLRPERMTMRIGLVSQALPYLPARGGFRLYGGNLIRHLSRRHEIHLVSLLIEDDAQHLDWAREYCASVTAIPAPKHPKLLAVPSALGA